MNRKTSDKAARFTESVIREMTRLANAHGAVNLSQGFPDFAAPEELKEAAARAIAANVNQYAVTWGAPNFRRAIAAKFERSYGVEVDADREVTVCCGGTEAMVASMMALLNPGDEVVTFEPFYENYGPDAILAGAVPKFVTLRAPDWSFDPAELRAAFSKRTRAIIMNSPHNPTGKVFTREELNLIASLCQEFDVVAVTDEIYEHILYDGNVHIPLATLPGMKDRTITINSMSKTYSVTGWRVGWAIAPSWITGAIRKVHDFLTVGAAAPLQEAGALALALPQSYYDELRAKYAERRTRMLGILEACGFTVYKPGGAYYTIVDTRPLGWSHDVEFARHLVEEIGVAVVPGSSFYQDAEKGRTQIRFAFSKKAETFDEAERRLRKLLPRA
jgi:aspartate/methionine/tyrosine aminotransferase